MFLNVYVFFLVSTLQGDGEQLPNVMEENRQSACAKRNNLILILNPDFQEILFQKRFTFLSPVYTCLNDSYSNNPFKITIRQHLQHRRFQINFASFSTTAIITTFIMFIAPRVILLYL